jgi:hypothetical protein
MKLADKVLEKYIDEAKETKREHIPYGYRTYAGIRISDKAVDKYNEIQDRINQYITKGRKPPKELLNLSHKLISDASMFKTEKEEMEDLLDAAERESERTNRWGWGRD